MNPENQKILFERIRRNVCPNIPKSEWVYRLETNGKKGLTSKYMHESEKYSVCFEHRKGCKTVKVLLSEKSEGRIRINKLKKSNNLLIKEV